MTDSVATNFMMISNLRQSRMNDPSDPRRPDLPDLPYFNVASNFSIRSISMS
jgi:hypothetical protein